jgi:Zn-dependent alcohol dehydrogenase
VIPKALDFVQRTRGKYPLGSVVSHKFPLERINDAFKQAEWLNRQTDVAITRAALTMG